MARQTQRLICIGLSLAVAAVAVIYGEAGIAGLCCFGAGMWFSAYMRRVAQANGVSVED